MDPDPIRSAFVRVSGSRSGSIDNRRKVEEELTIFFITVRVPSSVLSNKMQVVDRAGLNWLDKS